ncbi:hypothetical protein GCM10027425_07170 [Alteromonas gracilis]
MSFRARLCAAILIFEAIVLGLTTPVLISVVELDVALGASVGLGLALACILVAGMLRRSWAYPVGWVIQIAAIGLGVLVTAMYVLGLIFLALWAAAYILGGRIDDERAAAYAEWEASGGAGEGGEDAAPAGS